MKPQNNPTSKRPLIHFLPQDPVALRILRDRAERIAQQAVCAAQKAQEDSYVCFGLGTQEYYGLPYQHVQEVMHHLQPETLPQAPAIIAGVINRRGSLLAVLDLKRLFHIPAPTYENPYILIVTGNNMTVGFLADSIEGSNTYNPSTLDGALPSEGIIKSEFILGLHQTKIALLNVETILSDVQAQVRTVSSLS